MNKKALIGLLFLLHHASWAETIYPYEGFTEEPTYLLEAHGCATTPETKGLSLTIARNASYTALMLPPSRYQAIKYLVAAEIEREKSSSMELKKAWKKVSEFENSGNIQAMQHWNKKALSIELEIIRATNRRLLPSHAERIIADENPPTYYGRLHTEKFKTNTLQELIDATDDNCWKPIK